MALKPRVLPAPPPPAAADAAALAVIRRGLDAQAAPADGERAFKFRLEAALYASIEAAAKARPGKVSMNTWLTEAALEKLAREAEER